MSHPSDIVVLTKDKKNRTILQLIADSINGDNQKMREKKEKSRKFSE